MTTGESVLECDVETHTINKDYDPVKATNDYRQRLKWIIYPDNKWIKRWDFLILILLMLMLIVLPYQLGVSVGYYIFTNDGWYLSMIIIDVAFVIDTFLHFFRVYRHETTGRLVVNRKMIAYHHLKTAFIPSFLSSITFPSIFMRELYHGFTPVLSEDPTQQLQKMNSGVENKYLVILILLYGIRMSRLYHIRSILRSSNVFRAFLESGIAKPHRVDLLKYFLLLFLVSHWLACLWCSLVFFQTGSFGEEILYHKNWISLWYNVTYHGEVPEESDLLPIGWDRDVDRYLIALVWSVQSITGIGYGNVMPMSRVEWGFLSLCMLFSGLCWAFLLGSLMEVVTYMKSQSAPLSNLHNANVLTRDFPSNDTAHSSQYDKTFTANVALRIKNYVLDQRERKYSIGKCTSTLDNQYQIYDSLSLELQELSSYLLLRPHLELVPYLSSKFLDVKEASFISTRCHFQCFSAGETMSFNSNSNYGRSGISIILQGLALKKNDGKKNDKFGSMNVGKVFGYGEVLLESDVCLYVDEIIFPTYTRLLVIPREAVLESLARNPHAWKSCARWKYLHASLKYKFAPNVQRFFPKLMRPRYKRHITDAQEATR